MANPHAVSANPDGSGTGAKLACQPVLWVSSEEVPNDRTASGCMVKVRVGVKVNCCSGNGGEVFMFGGRMGLPEAL